MPTQSRAKVSAARDRSSLASAILQIIASRVRRERHAVARAQLPSEAVRRALRPHGARYVLLRCSSDKSAHRYRRLGSVFMSQRSGFPGQGPPEGQVLMSHVPMLLLLVLDVI